MLDVKSEIKEILAKGNRKFTKWGLKFIDSS